MNGLDETLLSWANGGLGPFLDAWLPRIGTAHDASPWMLAAVLLLVAFGTRRIAVTALLMLLVVGITDPGNRFLLKPSVDRARPCQVLDEVVLRHTHCPTSPSLPSSHALNTAAAATVLAVRHPALAIPGAVVALAVGTSRVHGGVHYPSDVAGGWGLGLLAGLLIGVPSRLRSVRERSERLWQARTRAARRHWAALGDTRWELALGLLVLAGLAVGLDAIATAGMDLSPAEARRWQASQSLDVTARPPAAAIAWIVHLTTGLVGDTSFGVRLGPVLLSAAFFLALFALARRITGSARDAFIAVVLLRLTPLFTLSGLLATSVGPFLLLWTLGLLAAQRALLSSSRPAWGLFVAAMASAAMVAAPEALGSLQTSTTPKAMRVLHALGTQLGLMLPWIAAPLLIGTVRSGRLALGGERGHRLLWCACAPWLLLFLAASAFGPVEAVWAAPAWIGAAIAGAAWVGAHIQATTTSDRQPLRRLVAACVLASTLAVLFVSHPAFFGYFYRSASDLHPARRLVGWNELAKHVESLAQDWRARGGEPRVVTDRPELASELRFYLPGHPDVPILPLGQSESVAPHRPPAEPPGPRANALLVTGRHGLHPAIALGFRRCVEAPRFLPTPIDAGPGWTRVYWCERYRGLPRTFP